MTEPSPEPPTDADLWQRIRADDSEAFADLFRRHGPTIHRYLLRRTGDVHGTEDLAATVFLEAWRQRHRTDLHQPSALPWLYGIATNLVRDRHRRRQRDERLSTRLAALPEPSADWPRTAERLGLRDPLTNRPDGFELRRDTPVTIYVLAAP